MANGSRADLPQDPHHAVLRLLLAILAAALTVALIPARLGPALRAVAAWDAAALVMGGLSWMIILRFSASETRQRAAADDPGRAAVWLLVLLASAFSLFSTA